MIDFEGLAFEQWGCAFGYGLAVVLLVIWLWREWENRIVIKTLKEKGLEEMTKLQKECDEAVSSIQSADAEERSGPGRLEIQ